MTGDPKLVFQIRKGRVPRPRMEAKILAYIDRVERDLKGRHPSIRAGRR